MSFTAPAQSRQWNRWRRDPTLTRFWSILTHPWLCQHDLLVLPQTGAPSAVKHTWELHPQLSPQGLGNASDDQVSRLPREKHAGATSVFGEVDVPGLLLHLFFELSITQLSTRHAVYALALQLSAWIVHHCSRCASLNAHPHSPSLPLTCIATIQSDLREDFTTRLRFTAAVCVS